MHRMRDLLPTFGRFLLVGLSGTLLNLVVLAALVKLGLVPAIAALLAIEVSIINNFIWNDRWTFKRKGQVSKGLARKRFMRFQLVTALTAGLTFGLFIFFNHFLNWHYLLAQLTAIGIATILNFGVNSKLTWALPPVQPGLELPFSFSNSREVE